MDHYSVSVPAPIEPPKELAEQFNDLSARLANLAALRAQAEREARSLEDGIKASLSQRDGAVIRAQAHVRLAELEMERLNAEIPQWLGVDSYLREAIQSRNAAIAVAHEMLDLTRQYVEGVYHRDYPPAKYRVRAAALAVFINNHPAVLGASDRLAELQANRMEAQVVEANERTIRAASDRLKRLPAMLANATAHLAAVESEAVDREALAQAANLTFADSVHFKDF
jgi:hypothetical protein